MSAIVGDRQCEVGGRGEGEGATGGVGGEAQPGVFLSGAVVCLRNPLWMSTESHYARHSKDIDRDSLFKSISVSAST